MQALVKSYLCSLIGFTGHCLDHFLFLLWISSLAEKLNHAGVMFQIFAEIV
jgi:hypothetical protein